MKQQRQAEKQGNADGETDAHRGHRPLPNPADQSHDHDRVEDRAKQEPPSITGHECRQPCHESRPLRNIPRFDQQMEAQNPEAHDHELDERQDTQRVQSGPVSALPPEKQAHPDTGKSASIYSPGSAFTFLGLAFLDGLSALGAFAALSPPFQ